MATGHCHAPSIAASTHVWTILAPRSRSTPLSPSTSPSVHRNLVRELSMSGCGGRTRNLNRIVSPMERKIGFKGPFGHPGLKARWCLGMDKTHETTDWTVRRRRRTKTCFEAGRLGCASRGCSFRSWPWPCLEMEEERTPPRDVERNGWRWTEEDPQVDDCTWLSAPPDPTAVRSSSSLKSCSKGYLDWKSWEPPTHLNRGRCVKTSTEGAGR